MTRLLSSYDATVGTWEEPLEALDLITQFHRYALPGADNLAQTTALVVDVAKAMRTAFVRDAFFGSVTLGRRSATTWSPATTASSWSP